jgi:hypothetical protein
LSDDTIPTVGEHRGVRLHNKQSAARLDLVRGEIDAVSDMADAIDLVAWAADVGHAPESRLLAAARAEALWELAAERREIRPDLNLDRLRASVAGCDSVRWRSPNHFCSDLDYGGGGGVPAPREVPLEG